jgi:hypothetical protein
MRKWICAFFLPLFTWISLSECAFLAAAQCDSKLLRFGHSGGATGSGSFLIIYPKRKAVLAWLQNSDDFRDPDFSRIVTPFFRSKAPVDPKSAANIVDR